MKFTIYSKSSAPRVGFLLFELRKRPTADGNEKSMAQTLSFFLFHLMHIVQSAVEGHGGNDASVRLYEYHSNHKRV